MKRIEIKAVGPWALKSAPLFVTGSCDALGSWNPDKAVAMRSRQGIVWSVSLDADTLPDSFEFKFIRKEAGDVEWESRPNRNFITPRLEDGGTLTCPVPEIVFADSRPRYAGTAIPVFSLRSEKDWGTGDFADIKLLSDWASSTGQSVVQLLPVNDTTSTSTWTDSYPYSGISIMALHPIYLHPEYMGLLNDRSRMEFFEGVRRELNALPQMDYERVYNLKFLFFKEIYLQNGHRDESSEEYVSFFDRNRDWLLNYAAFCALRDIFGTADFSQWKEYAVYDEAVVEDMWNGLYDGKFGGMCTDNCLSGCGEKYVPASLGKCSVMMRFHVFLQYHLDRQLHDAHEYAVSLGVALKGDIPIGITPHSVEAWVEPYLFNMDEQAGAPPDIFASDGQNWRFPTYNWERMAVDGYSWWKRRFTKMAEYFDAYRIDHILGFFRIWEIPSQYSSGLMGHFSPALPYTPQELLREGFVFDYRRDAMSFIDDNPSEVLFVEDPVKKGCFHPAIGARSTESYKALGEEEKTAFDKVYDEFFFRRHNEFWREKAMDRLPVLIEATDMLTCAEDLGMIPSCVPQVLDDLHILSLEVQRMPKNPGEKLGRPFTYPYYCVCTTGSHDTSTLRGWWAEEHSGEDCPVETCRWIVAEHLHSPAMLAVLPLQDWFSVSESMRTPDPSSDRINVPANPKHYWRWRMHINLEELCSAGQFNETVALMIRQGGRCQGKKVRP